MKRWRFLFIQGFFFFLLAAVAARLFYWQVLKYDHFVLAASDQHLTTITITNPRGRILASDGNILVSNQPAYLLYAYISDIKKNLNKESYGSKVNDIVDKIAPIILNEEINNLKEPNKLRPEDRLQMDQNLHTHLTSELNMQGVYWVPLAEKLSESSYQQIKNLNIPGLSFEDQSKRFYAEGVLASSVLGFVGSDSNGNDKGYFGLEGFYENQLQGRSGKLTQEVDAAGRPIIAGATQETQPKEGFDIQTTIDRTVQYTVEKYLFDGAKKFGVKGASAIVLDAKTGAVLALANYPYYDPAKWDQYTDAQRDDQAISDSYEPGSTFKIVTASAALDSGVVQPDTICPCTGPINTNGYTVETWNNKYNPNSDMAAILEHSDNVGAAFWAEKLGKNKFIDYLNRFGLGSQTGIDLQGEAAGLVKPSRDWQNIDLVTGAFGQGVSVTALQMTLAAAVVANDGKMMKPYVVQKIFANGKELDTQPQVVRQVIKPEVATIMKGLLLQAVDQGEAKRIIPHDLRVAGKTGTAQIPLNGQYDPNKTVASFVGFGPVENPKFVMIVKYVEPSDIYGADTAEPTFFKIAQDLYTYWGIARHE